ncbi:MAG: hypothetical protein M1826_000445 [Phylliscum demangeonii]|nr:MAG: hypothetical protein M1826_000445 [Phylliscum demangeonii]
MASRSKVESWIQKHPLQRMASPSAGFSALIHVLGLASFAASFKHNDSYGWHFQYLTNLGLALATITFCLGLAADVTLSPALFMLKNVLAMTSLPLEVLVSAMYWGLRAIDPKLVVPEFMILDPLADFGFHVMPAFLLTLDLLLLSPPWTITILPSVGTSLSAIVMMASTATLHWLYGRINGFGDGAQPRARSGAAAAVKKA